LRREGYSGRFRSIAVDANGAHSRRSMSMPP
jgi:hypothetical protein